MVKPSVITENNMLGHLFVCDFIVNICIYTFVSMYSMLHKYEFIVLNYEAWGVIHTKCPCSILICTVKP